LRHYTKAGGQFAFDSYRRLLDMYGDVVLAGRCILNRIEIRVGSAWV
jgi:hypothetical protein